MTTDQPEIPEWFWSLLEASRPHLQTLAESLEELPEERLIAYAQAYDHAAEELCDYWAGPLVDGVAFSEDDTEDLCRWIVSQGPAFYTQALALHGDLASLVHVYWASERGEDRAHPPWRPELREPAYRGYQNPSAVVHAVYQRRFGRPLQNELA